MKYLKKLWKRIPDPYKSGLIGFLVGAASMYYGSDAGKLVGSYLASFGKAIGG